METVETKKEGMFVMPKDRVQIHSSYVYTPTEELGRGESCEAKLEDLQARFQAQEKLLHRSRTAVLP